MVVNLEREVKRTYIEMQVALSSLHSVITTEGLSETIKNIQDKIAVYADAEIALHSNKATPEDILITINDKLLKVANHIIDTLE